MGRAVTKTSVMDPVRRKILKMGAAATAMAAVRRVFGQEAGKRAGNMSFYEKGLRAKGRSEHVSVEGAQGADSARGAPDTFLAPGTSLYFRLDGGVYTA